MNLSKLSRLSEEEARALLESIRWPNGPVCPHCGSVEGATKLEGKKHRAGLYKCNPCGEQFTVTVGTIMEQSHLPIRTWLMAFSIMCSSKKGVSAAQLQRQLGIGSYRSAWHLAHRIRFAMTQSPLSDLLHGIVEVDETYVGGKPRKGKGGKPNYGRSTKKQPVLALVERTGKKRARAFPIADVTSNTLMEAIPAHVDWASALHTDEWSGYKRVGAHFILGHHTVAHAKGEYARGDVTSNTVEAYFALLKRGIMGSFHSVSRKHLHRYCNEFSFRWDHRNVSDGERTATAILNGDGKRLKYRSPIMASASMG